MQSVERVGVDGEAGHVSFTSNCLCGKYTAAIRTSTAS